MIETKRVQAGGLSEISVPVVRRARLVFGVCLMLAAAGCTTQAFQGVKPQTAANAGTTTGGDAKVDGESTSAVAGTATTTSTTTVPGVSEAAVVPARKQPASSAPRPPKKRIASRKPAVAKGTAAKTAAARNRGTADQNADFVEDGVARSDTYPDFVPPRAATTQMTDTEKSAFEAQMAERMKAGANPAETRAEYDARVKLMRALAAEQGSDTLKTTDK